MISRSAIPAKRLQPFPLSKCMDPEVDLFELATERTVVDAAQATEGQHPMRVWEYAMAHRAIGDWQKAQQQADGYVEHALCICDVGGAGSQFALSLSSLSTSDIDIVDPAIPQGIITAGHLRWIGLNVETYAGDAPHDQYDVLTVLSVLEHVQEVRPFLRACRMLLKPGGLLFLTMDCWNCSGPDTAHFHWMRKRIYNPDLIRKLQQDLRELGYSSFGRGEWSYHGNFVFDYSFGSLAMVKKG